MKPKLYPKSDEAGYSWLESEPVVGMLKNGRKKIVVYQVEGASASWWTTDTLEKVDVIRWHGL